jgi:putative ABC transport system permease protein
MIIQQGRWKAGIGLVVRFIGALILSRDLKSLLFKMKPTDPIVYFGVSLLLLLVALLASRLLAKRAAKIDPMVALRVD